jgi:formate hydrogenlyase subunit 3/multisubunit Na+/H+ antiporter MnhD subunit
MMTTGLLLKSALFPLHFWLPPAHSSAPAPVSGLLSALVVKASFYILIRLWFLLFSDILTPAAGQLLGVFAAAAILWGSFLALRQSRLKLLVAYSTVAQLGYMFLLFPLSGGSGWDTQAWGGSIYFALSHACAKAAMFMSAGCILYATGHDRIAEFAGLAKRLPVPVLAFAVAGLSIMGMPPSGGFVAKWQLLAASIQSGQWWWAVVMLAGGLLAAAYFFRALNKTIVPENGDTEMRAVPYSMQIPALGLAIMAMLLGFTATTTFDLLMTGLQESG